MGESDLRMSRLWVCEPIQTATGTLADERISLPAADVVCVAIGVLDELRRLDLDVPLLAPALVRHARRRLGAALPRVREVAADLVAHRGAGAVLVGDRQPAAVHALARWIDHACGNVGTTVRLTAPALADPLGGETLEALVRGAARSRAVVVIDTDPVYAAPDTLGLATALRDAPLSLHAGLYRDQTALACGAHVPLAHELEAWSDARAWDGTLTIGQPLVRPRFDIASPIDVIAALCGESRDGRTLVREQLGASEGTWISSLRAGVVENTRAATARVPPHGPHELDAAIAQALVLDTPSTIEIALAPSPNLGDGRFAANAWLQELPHPITKQTWGNAALMSRATADRFGVDDEELITLSTTSGDLTLPVLVVDAACDGSITVELGHGHAVPSAPIADRVGGNAYRLRAGAGWILRGSVRPLGAKGRVVRTQTTMTEHGRDIAPVATLARFRSQPDLLAHLRGEQPSLLPAQDETGTQWGMSIDTSICTGCGACMVACQAENNIPTVGADDVARGRHMNWIRIDRYVHDDGSVVNEPMPCQHCENAPCEYVCPVNATTHSPDGLNEQVYNRCVGTRFCSNNCPYKVRRFNWFQYEKADERSLQYNPDVTVRSRGVMEKCTYCVQRIRRAEHQALVDHRAIRTGEVVTACQQACPTRAIQFGELHERGTLFAQLRRDPRRFDILHDLGTRPRTQYLAKIVNPRSEE
jgi:molybdopterin-containing oxidoreductase family iron-sulfur binding subunit